MRCRGAWSSSWWTTTGSTSGSWRPTTAEDAEEARLALLVLDQLGLVGGHGGLADETVSLSAVVSSVPRVCPAVTCWPGVTVTVATWPATWNEAAASLTGSTLPTTSRSCRCRHGSPWPCRYPAAAVADLGPGGHAAAEHDDEDDGADQDGAPVAGTAPARAEPDLGTRHRRRTAEATAGTATEAGRTPKPLQVPLVAVIRTVVAVTAPLRGCRAEGADAVTHGEVGRRCALGGAHRGRTRRRDLEGLRLGRRSASWSSTRTWSRSG